MPNNKVAPADDADGADVDRLRKRGSAGADFAEPQRSASLTAALKQVDLDGDGVVEDWEVEKVVAEKDAATNDATDARKTLVLVLLILAASMVSNAITMMAVVDQSKDTETQGGYLTDRAGKALRTDTSKDVVGLTSLLPDSYFRRLDSFDVTGPKGSLHVHVTGFARYQDANAQYNSTVMLFCSLGTVAVDGAQLYFTESSNGAYTFSRVGLNLTSDAARRDRRELHHLRARRDASTSPEKYASATTQAYLTRNGPADTTTTETVVVVGQKLYYPKENGDTCTTDGTMPEGMRENPDGFGSTTLDGCCALHFSWNVPVSVNICLGADPETVLGQEPYYPDWSSTGIGCRADAEAAPDYMRENPLYYFANSLDACCKRYFAWNYDSCVGTVFVGYYPDWEGANAGCLADGNPPKYMQDNHAIYLHDTADACCERHYSSAPEECLEASDPATTTATSITTTTETATTTKTTETSTTAPTTETAPTTPIGDASFGPQSNETAAADATADNNATIATAGTD